MEDCSCTSGDERGREVTKKVFASLLLLFLPISALHAVTHSHLFTAETSVVDGCRYAVEQLKRETIESSCGSHLSGGVLRVQGDHQDFLERLYFESTAGFVTQYHLISQQVEMVEPLPGESLLRCTVEAELEVQCNQGERDPQFAPLFEQQVALNQPSFEVGEEMVVEVVPQHFMVITILQLIPYLQGEERVWRIFPNEFDVDNHFEAGVAVLIPDQSQNDYQLIVDLPDGRARALEELVILATRAPVDFPEKMSVEQFHRLLSEIPLDQRRELFIPYEINQPKRAGVVR